MSSNRLSLEAILAIVPDEAKATQIKKMMDDHEASWSRISKTVDHIGDSVESIARAGMGLAGIASVGSVLGNFFNTSQMGSNLALAAGNVTGGASTWHPYGQALLGAQAKTGVNATAIGQGLIQAVQALGGDPTPNQAAVLGGLIAGYGQTVGLTPSQVSQVVAPLLQAANKPLTAANVLGTATTLTSGLSNMPGSQAAPMLGLISQLGLTAALGSGPGGGYTSGLSGIVAAINSAVGANSVWRNPSTTGSAVNSITGALQNAYGSPSQEAFLQMAGVGYQAQRQGFSASNVQSIMGEATKLYGTGNTRDMMLRSMFGITGADFLETFSPGSKAAGSLNYALAHPANKAAQEKLKSQMAHAQQRTTPDAVGTIMEGTLLHALESNGLTAVAGLGGLVGLKSLLSRSGLARNGAKSILQKLLGGGSEDAAGGAADDAGGGALADLLGLGGSAASAGLGVTALALLSPASAGINPNGTNAGPAKYAVAQALKAAQKKFGANFGNTASEEWLWNQFGYRQGVGGRPKPGTPGRSIYWGEATSGGEDQKGETTAQQILSKIFSELNTPQDPITTFSQAATKLLQFANKLGTGPGRVGTAFDLSGTGGSSALGTPAIQAMTPSMEFTALALGAGGSMAAGGGSAFASLALSGVGATGSGGNTTPAAGGGWQPCTLTWYNPALGGTNSSNGQANASATMANGQPYSQTANTCAAPSNYPFGSQIAFSYRGKSVTCTVTDRGGAITGNHFDLSVAAANTLGMMSAGKVAGQFKVLSTGKTTTSSGSGGASGSTGGGSSSGGAVTGSQMMAALASVAGTSAGTFPSSSGTASAGGGGVTHIHVHIDGRQIQKARVMRGYKS